MHTPGPWTYRMAYNNGEPTNYVIQAGATAIADLCIGIADGPDQEEADAAFIVRAANCHDELLGALKELQKQLHAHHKMNVKKDFSLMVADAAAGNAIAKAEGRTP